jgi:Reverse transcriptase (RNA-dependent DNA polymerase)
VVSEDDMLGKNIRESTEPVAGCLGRHFLYFDNMSHEWTMKFNEHRVADRRILRLIWKWLKAGVSEDGQWSETKLGTPQGAVVSPPLANVYLHYAFDLRGEAWRKKVAKGDVIIVRYADDLVLGFQHRAEAERFLADCGEEANGGQAQSHQDRAATPEASSHDRRRWLASPLRIPGKSRMRKRACGSVRGAISDGRPYRDS